MSDINFTEDQLAAIKNPISTQEALKKAWDDPRIFHFDKKRHAYIVLIVSEEKKDKYEWSVSVRIIDPKKGKVKPILSMTKAEKLRVRLMLINEIDSVGKALGEREFETKYAMHMAKSLTDEELEVMKNPSLLGN